MYKSRESAVIAAEGNINPSLSLISEDKIPQRIVLLTIIWFFHLITKFVWNIKIFCNLYISGIYFYEYSHTYIYLLSVIFPCFLYD